MTLRTILWDNDGVLVDTEELYFEATRQVLDRLHGTARMGIVTSSRKEHFELIHRTTGLLDFIDFVLTRQDYERTKPHPDPYLAALRRFDLRPEECVAVEDSLRGLRAARAAGIRCIVVPNALTRGADFEGAHAVVDDLQRAHAEIRRLIET